MRLLLAGLLSLSLYTQAQIINIIDYGVNPNSFADATAGVRNAITDCRSKQQTVINFPTGRYDFWPANAAQTNYYISNSSSAEEMPVKQQRVGILLKELKNVTIEGNGSTFIFHGKMITWVIDSSENIHIRNLAIDYERPGMSEMTILELTSTAVIAEVHPDSRFAIMNGQLQWYGEKWVTRNYHAVLVDPKEGLMTYSEWEPFLNSKAEIVKPNTVRFTGDFSNFRAAPGNVLTIRDRYRDYVGVFHNRSKNITLQNVHMNSMHGLGIVSQFCENLDYDSVYIEPASRSGRLIASSADGMHFSGCKGQITINHCRFNGMHDDPVNVHGTHLIVSEVISPSIFKVRFMHPQTYGFLPFVAGDSIASLHAASLQIFGTAIVKSVRLINEYDVQVELQQPLSNVKAGDAFENITWTPALSIQNSRFERTNTRGTLITTRRKVLIENNVYYRIGMHAILIENDASGWYESGPVTDVIIRNNQFIECGYNSFPDNYIISIHPEAHAYIKGNYVHSNIRIENNLFRVYDYPLIYAYSTRGLSFISNKIERSKFKKPGGVRAAFYLKANTAVIIGKNIFEGENPQLVIHDMTASDIKSDIPVLKQ